MIKKINIIKKEVKESIGCNILSFGAEIEKCRKGVEFTLVVEGSKYIKEPLNISIPGGGLKIVSPVYQDHQGPSAVEAAHLITSINIECPN